MLYYLNALPVPPGSWRNEGGRCLWHHVARHSFPACLRPSRSLSRSSVRLFTLALHVQWSYWHGWSCTRYLGGDARLPAADGAHVPHGNNLSFTERASSTQQWPSGVYLTWLTKHPVAILKLSYNEWMERKIRWLIQSKMSLWHQYFGCNISPHAIPCNCRLSSPHTATNNLTHWRPALHWPKSSESRLPLRRCLPCSRMGRSLASGCQTPPLKQRFTHVSRGLTTHSPSQLIVLRKQERYF